MLVVTDGDVVDEDIDLAEALGDPFDERFDAVFVGDIGEERLGGAAGRADFFGDPAGTVRIDIGNGDACPSRASSFAVASPMLRPAPVMTAT